MYKRQAPVCEDDGAGGRYVDGGAYAQQQRRDCQASHQTCCEVEASLQPPVPSLFHVVLHLEQYGLLVVEALYFYVSYGHAEYVGHDGQIPVSYTHLDVYKRQA